MQKGAALSHKRIFKATLLSALITAGVFGLFIWVFGGQVELQTEIIPIPDLANVESGDYLPVFSKTNLTEDISEIIAREIVAENPSGPVSGADGSQIAGINPDQLVASTLEESLASFDLEELRGSVDQSLILFNKNADLSAQAVYFATINSLIKKEFQNASINFENPAQTDFRSLALAYESSVQKLYQIPVPRIISGFHSRLIGLFATKKNIYSLLNNYQSDPFQALLATEFGDQIDNELVILSNEMNLYIEENDIDF